MNASTDVVVTDVVVAGGGIAGLSVAWRLAHTHHVVLVEREPHLATHTTGRSAAMLNVTSGSPVVRGLAAQSWSFLAHPPAGFCDLPLLAPRGLLWVGTADACHRLDRLATSAGASCRRLDPADVRAVVPSVGVAAAGGGVIEPDASVIDVAALVDGYRRGFLAQGGDIVLSHELLAAEHDGSRWTVRAGEHVIIADVIVDAAGAWADEVAHRCGVRPIGLRPARRTAALVAAPEHTARWPMVMDVDLGWYAEPEAGGLLVSPMDETPTEPCDAQPEEVDVALAIERVNAALGLQLRHVRRAWAGLRTFTADRDPVAGPDPAQPAFVWLAGQGGSGIKTAPALAEIVANAISSGAAVPAALDPARFRSADR